MKHFLWCVLALSGIATPAFAAGTTQETSALPRVLLIGDSIAGGYFPLVKEALKSTAEVVLVKRAKQNAASDNAIEEMDSWLAGQTWAVVHFNWGLWDLKLTKEGRNNIPIEQYGKNLRELVQKIKQSGATPIFATTTPVPDRVLITPRRTADALLYNTVALKIMEESQVHVDDLYTAVLPRLVELQNPSDVHFNSDGDEFLARRVVKAVEFMLYLRKVLPPSGSRTDKTNQ
jgi:hypothetical protein